MQVYYDRDADCDINLLKGKKVGRTGVVAIGRGAEGA